MNKKSTDNLLDNLAYTSSKIPISYRETEPYGMFCIATPEMEDLMQIPRPVASTQGLNPTKALGFQLEGGST